MYRNLLIFIIICLSTTLSSQNGFILGVDAGYNIYTIANQNNYGQKELDYEKPEYHILYGGHVGYKFNHKHQVRVGLQSYTSGQSYEDNINNGRYRKNVELSYLGVPITYRFTTGPSETDNEGIKFFLEGGPMISFLSDGSLNHEIRNNQGSDFEEVDFNTFYLSGGNPHSDFILSQDLTTEEGEDAKTFYKSTDLLFTFGFGAQAYLGNNLMLSLGLNAAVSIIDINSEEWQIDNNDGNYELSRNSYAGVDISISYLF